MSFNHDAECIYEACGVDQEKLQPVIQMLEEMFNSDGPSPMSKAVEDICEMGLTDVELVLAGYTLSSAKDKIAARKMFKHMLGGLETSMGGIMRKDDKKDEPSISEEEKGRLEDIFKDIDKDSE